MFTAPKRFTATKRFAAIPVLLTLFIAPLVVHAAQSLPVVTAATIETQADGVGRTYLGRLEAVQAVNITSRTEGFIARRAFEEGQFVNGGKTFCCSKPFWCSKHNVTLHVMPDAALFEFRERNLIRKHQI